MLAEKRSMEKMLTGCLTSHGNTLAIFVTIAAASLWRIAWPRTVAATFGRTCAIPSRCGTAEDGANLRTRGDPALTLY